MFIVVMDNYSIIELFIYHDNHDYFIGNNQQCVPLLCVYSIHVFVWRVDVGYSQVIGVQMVMKRSQFQSSTIFTWTIYTGPL